MDVIEILRLCDLARCMRQKRRAHLAALDPVPVVRHADPVFPAPFDLNGNIFCASVQTVFDKLFDNRIRPVYNFARRNAIKNGTV